MNHKKLTLKDRKDIKQFISKGLNNAQIAKKLSKHRCGIGRELKGWSRKGYNPKRAHQLAVLKRQNKPTKKVCKEQILNLVTTIILFDKWSPMQISKYLKSRYPTLDCFHVSHETLYKWIYQDPQLLKKLRNSLRRKKKRRGPYQSSKRGGIKNKVSIKERPEQINDRSEFGHWEGDLLIGKVSGTYALAVFIERVSRYVKLIFLDSKKSENLISKIKEHFEYLPESVRLSMTYDQGLEMANHQDLSGIFEHPVYFCDPGCPYQKGAVENTNSLLRDFFPKGSDFSNLTVERVAEVELILNQRPRETLNYLTPSEVFNLRMPKESLR